MEHLPAQLWPRRLSLVLQLMTSSHESLFSIQQVDEAEDGGERWDQG